MEVAPATCLASEMILAAERYQREKSVIVVAAAIALR